MMRRLFTFLLLTGILTLAFAQQEIQLPETKTKGVTYSREEMQFYSEAWATTAVDNVSEASLTLYEPSEDKKNGTAVIIAPGGGLYALSINSEGRDVAQWLTAKGVTAFVLKYHLVPTIKDGTQQIGEEWGQDYGQVLKKVNQVLPTSIQDGLNAIEHVRTNAEIYGVDPQKIGFMGFSAGGAVTMGVGYEYTLNSRPNFLVPVYPWTDAKSVETPQPNAPPMLIICATNDGIGLAKGAVALYTSYFENELNVALHMYSKGDHGFGMKVQGLPSDSWIERFYDWAVAEQLIVPRKNY